MANSVLLLGFVLAATYTDVRTGKILNKTTYPGMIVGLIWSAAATLFRFDVASGTEFQQKWIGALPLSETVLGFLLCGLLMVVCYLFFAGGIGGGDIKLIAMIGVYFGIWAGLTALLWTFMFALVVGVISLIWQVGVWDLLKRVMMYLSYLFRFRARPAIRDEDRKPLKTKLYLGPSALAAVVLVGVQLFLGIEM